MKCRNRFELVKRIFEREEHWIIKLSFWVVEESLRGQKAPLRSDWRSLRVEKAPLRSDWKSLRVQKAPRWTDWRSLRGQKAPRWTDWRSLRVEKAPLRSDWRLLRVEHEEKVWREGRKHAIGVCEFEHGI